LDTLRQNLKETLDSNCNEEEKLHKIMTLRLLYTKLVDIVTQIGHCFGLQLLLICFTSIASLTVSDYILFTTQMKTISQFDVGLDNATPLLALIAVQMYFATFTLTFILVGGTLVKNSGNEVHI
jgi:hypothetical protein